MCPAAAAPRLLLKTTMPHQYVLSSKMLVDHNLTRSSQGPVMAESLPEAAGKDELKKRAAELNK